MANEPQRMPTGAPPQRPVDPKQASLARAEARLREIRQTLPEGGESRDKYAAPPPPDGWSYEWKVRTVMGQEDPSVQVEHMRNGWEPVPLSRHPEMMPRGWKGDHIEIGGLVLMERPQVLTDEARRREQYAAREMIATKEQQMKTGRPDDLGRRQVNTFRKTRESIPIPGDSE